MKPDVLERAKQVFDTEIQSLTLVRDSLDDTFCRVAEEIISCRGRVIVSGVGKSGHIANKISATLASLGTPSFFLHPAEALHGDLGMVTGDDIVIMISHSGESEELVRLIPNIKLIGAALIAISSNPNSIIVKNSRLSIIMPAFEEACFMGLAPTSSTTAALVTGDALAITAAFEYGFTEQNYGLFHPSGALGKKVLLKVSDIMAPKEQCAVVHEGSTMIDAIINISKYSHGLVVVENEHNEVIGVFSDGDLRRQLEKRTDIYSMRVSEVMTANPTYLPFGILAAEALDILRKKRVFAAPVITADRKLCGIVTLQDILSSGLGL